MRVAEFLITRPLRCAERDELFSAVRQFEEKNDPQQLDLVEQACRANTARLQKFIAHFVLDIDDSLAFWEQRSQGLVQWLWNRNRKAEVQGKIQKLEHLRNGLLELLGFYTHIDNVVASCGCRECVPLLLSRRYKLDDFLRTGKVKFDTPKIDPTNDVSGLVDSLKYEISSVEAFGNDILAQNATSFKPFYLRGGLLTRSTGLASVLGVSKFLYKHSSLNGSNDLELWTSSAFQYAEQHAWIPLRRIHSQVFLSATKSSVDRESLAVEHSSLTRMLRDFAKSKFADTELLEDALAAARKGNMTMVMKTYEQQIKQPLLSFARGELTQLILIQVQKLKANVEEEMLQLNEILRTNETTVQLLALIPTMVGLYVLYGCGGYAYTLWRRRRNLAHIPLAHQAVRNIGELRQLALDLAVAQKQNPDELSKCGLNARPGWVDTPRDTWITLGTFASKLTLLIESFDLLNVSRHSKALMIEEAQFLYGRTSPEEKLNCLQRLRLGFHVLQV